MDRYFSGRCLCCFCRENTFYIDIQRPLLVLQFYCRQRLGWRGAQGGVCGDGDGRYLWVLTSYRPCWRGVGVYKFCGGRMANEEVEALGAREAMALKLHSNNITCAAFWSEEDLVCTGSMDNTLMLWRVRDGWNHRLRAHCGWVTCCAFQPRGSMLASGILVAVALFCPYARSLSALQVSFDACSRQVCKCQ